MAKKRKDKKRKKTSGKKGVRSIMRSNKPDANRSTQQYLPFREIRDGMVVMKDGTLRTVLMVSSLNFSLKSEDEQRGIIQGYVSFLNTIEYELQIVIQSRKLNIEKYLLELDGLARQQDNDLLRKQTLSYKSFIGKLVEEADIMDKRFFVVVPLAPNRKKRKSFWHRLQEVISPASVVKMDQAKMEKYIEEMDRRVGAVQNGLQSMSLQVQKLDTQALIELFYSTYNPATNQQNRIEDIDEMQVDRSVL